MSEMKDASPERQVYIDLVSGSLGVEFRPAALRISVGTLCIWRNQTSQPQVVLPVAGGPPFKGGTLLVGGTRAVHARKAGVFAFQPASNPTTQITMVVTDE